MSFRIFLSMMVLCCVQKSTNIFLQALGKPIMSMTLSLLRDFLLSVPLILILPKLFGLGVVDPLYSGPIADIISFLVAVVMMVRVFGSMQTERG